MKVLRQLLAVLVAFSIAATPVAARAAVPVQLSSKMQVFGTEHATAPMQDCHRMKEMAAKKDAPTRKHCPDCDKGSSCSADLCKLKCYKLIGAIDLKSKSAPALRQPFAAIARAEKPPLEIAPKLPPPRI